MMSHPSAIHQVGIQSLRLFAESGTLYRAYDHLIAARHGAFLLVPAWRVQGRFDQVLDGCPVPWQEVLAVIEDEYQTFVTELVKMPRIHKVQNTLSPLGLTNEWTFDFIGVHDQTRRNVLRLQHPLGVKYATADY